MNISHDGYIRMTWGAAGAAVCATIYVILWLAGVDSKATDSLNRIERHKEAIKDMRSEISDINARTIRMEAVLNFIKDRKN